MGFLRDLLFSPERRKDEAAINIDVEAGALRRCPICKTAYSRGGEGYLPAADALAHEMFERGDPKVAPFGNDREDLLARLRSVRESAPYGCTCENA